MPVGRKDHITADAGGSVKWPPSKHLNLGQELIVPLAVADQRHAQLATPRPMNSHERRLPSTQPIPMPMKKHPAQISPPISAV